MAKISSTDLDVFPLALGGNVFGWTADEKQSFAVLDAYREGGGNFIDTADLYYAHSDDEQTPLGETLGAFDALVREGKVRYIAASNYTAPRLAEALAVSDRDGLARYVALQQHYNLMERDKFEGELANAVAREKLSSLPYFPLASGFLTGKYRPGSK